MEIAVTLGASFLASILMIPLVRSASLRLGKVARPREDRWHSRPTPTLGGIGIFLGFVVGLVVGLLVGGGEGEVQWGLLGGVGLMFLLGLVDDLYEITPPTKLLGQILVAALVILLGITTRFFSPRIANNLVAEIPNILLTFIWLVGITNAINLLDNIDGLAGGIALITASILSYFFWRSGNLGLLFVSVALVGSLSGFLIFNFPPASIFMGDSGSMFLGFTLAILAIAHQPQASNVFAVLGVPTLLFLLPILDTTLVTFTRLLRGQSPAQGGRDHTSHRLIAFGLSERQAVLVMYGVALASGVVAAVLESLDYDFSLVLVPLLVMSLALITAYLARLKVVPSSTPVRQGTVNRLLVELTYRRPLFEIILDFFLISAAYYLAFWTRFGMVMTDTRLEMFVRSLPVAVGGAYISFFLFGIYRGVWRYVGVGDLLRYAKVTLGSVLLVALIDLLLFSGAPAFTPVLYILFAVYLFLGLAASRSSFKILDELSSRQTRPFEERVIIYGAGDAGEMALRWILMNPQLGYRPVGFLDDDPFKVGREIHGVQILGGLDQLEPVLAARGVDGVLVTTGLNDNTGHLDQVLAVTHTQGCWVRSLRLEFELLE